MRTVNSLIGSPVERIEDLRFLRGRGEGGIIPVGGVIANAVANALSSLGVEPCELPLSPSRVWGLIAAARQVAQQYIPGVAASVDGAGRDRDSSALPYPRTLKAFVRA